MSVAYIGPKLRTERPRKTKIGTEVAHVMTRTYTTFEVKGQGITRPLFSPHCSSRVRRLQRWAWERVGHGKLLLRCCLLGIAKGASAPTGGGGAGTYRGGHPPTACCFYCTLLSCSMSWDYWSFIRGRHAGRHSAPATSSLSSIT